jgi:hypothetical protein
MTESDCARRAPAPVARVPDHENPAKFIDFATAPDGETAEKHVAEEHEISDRLRNRLVAIRAEL